MRIPATIEQATEALVGIESLLTKKGWERAAILAAFVRLPGKPGPASKDSRNSGYLNARQFAELGIAGLTFKDTVQSYVQTWLDTHDGVYPEPGAEVTLPEGGYPSGGPRRNTQGELIGSATTEKIVESLSPEKRVEVAKALVETVPREDLMAVRDTIVERVMIEHELENVLDDIQPVVPEPTSYGVLDAVADITEARLRLKNAGRQFLAAIRDFGSFAANDPSADEVRTVALEALTLIGVHTEMPR